MGVIAVTKGSTTFVESNLPPSPTSMIAISTFCFTKYSKAITVVVSKKVELILCICFLFFSMNFAINSSGM